MPTSITTQEQLFGNRDTDHGSINIQNKHLYTYLNTISHIIDEANVHFDNNQISTQAVDPANVCMISAVMDHDHDLEDVTIGMSVDTVSNKLQNKPRAVDVDLDLALPYGALHISQEYANDRVWNVTERIGYLDPKSVREEPDINKFSFNTTVELEFEPIEEFIKHVASGDPIELSVSDGEFHISEFNDDSDTSGRYLARASTSVDVSSDAESIYSYGYWENIIRSIDGLGCESVTVEWNEEYPVHVSAFTDQMSFDWFVAPRIKK